MTAEDVEQAVILPMRATFPAPTHVRGDARATLALFEVWEPLQRIYGLPVTLVAQDGLEDLVVPWDRIACLFIGGSSRWKLGGAAVRLVREAKARGLSVHLGRCNTRQRLRYAWEIECDSCNGSGFSRFPQRIPLALRWLEEFERQPSQLAA